MEPFIIRERSEKFMELLNKLEEKLCRIIDDRKIYSTYYSYIKKHAPDLYDNYKISNHAIGLNNKICRILYTGPHEEYPERTLCIIENIDTNEIYLINKNGLKEII